MTPSSSLPTPLFASTRSPPASSPASSTLNSSPAHSPRTSKSTTSLPYPRNHASGSTSRNFSSSSLSSSSTNQFMDYKFPNPGSRPGLGLGIAGLEDLAYGDDSTQGKAYFVNTPTFTFSSPSSVTSGLSSTDLHQDAGRLGYSGSGFIEEELSNRHHTLSRHHNEEQPWSHIELATPSTRLQRRCRKYLVSWYRMISLLWLRVWIRSKSWNRRIKMFVMSRVRNEGREFRGHSVYSTAGVSTSTSGHENKAVNRDYDVERNGGSEEYDEEDKFKGRRSRLLLLRIRYRNRFLLMVLALFLCSYCLGLFPEPISAKSMKESISSPFSSMPSPSMLWKGHNPERGRYRYLPMTQEETEAKNVKYGSPSLGYRLSEDGDRYREEVDVVHERKGGFPRFPYAVDGYKEEEDEDENEDGEYDHDDDEENKEARKVVERDGVDDDYGGGEDWEYDDERDDEMDDSAVQSAEALVLQVPHLKKFSHTLKDSDPISELSPDPTTEAPIETTPVLTPRLRKHRPHSKGRKHKESMCWPKRLPEESSECLSGWKKCCMILKRGTVKGAARREKPVGIFSWGMKPAEGKAKGFECSCE